MFGVLVILFTVIPAIEIYLLFNIGGAIGGMSTFLVVITTGIVGAALAKSQGLHILNKVQTDLAKGELPADQLVHGFLVFGGGLLLLTPGFLTDALGLSMVIPGSRHFYAAFLKSKVKSGLDSGTIKFSSFGAGSSSGFAGGFQSDSFDQSPPESEQTDQQVQNDTDTFDAEYSKKE
jgi:UPF0716 protein FxsA